MTRGTSDGDGQSTDRGRLVDHHQHRPMFGEFVEHLPQPGLRVHQRGVMQTLPVTIQGHGVMAVLAYV
jgi:hypothetical protein